MAATGFFEQKKASPLGLGAVLALHGAAIAGVLMIQAPQWFAEPKGVTKVFNVPVDPPPPPPEPLPTPEQPAVAQISRVDVSQPIIQPRDFNAVPVERIVSPPGPIVGNDPRPSTGTGPVGEPRIVDIPPREPIRTPVRVAAIFDPRHANALQPPYPASEVRRDREGTVRVRVTIGPDGRVTSAQRVDATSDAFWEATRRQALTAWRFRPATLDGRAVESVKIVSIQFRLNG